MIIPTPVTDITDTSNLIFRLGAVLEELDILISRVMRLRESLLRYSVTDEGTTEPGLVALEV